MPRIYVKENEINDNTVVLEGERATHLSRSLRMRVGDGVTLCNGEKMDYEGVIESINSTQVCVKILKGETSPAEPFYRARLFMALPKSDKMEMIVQKAVETGVYEIVPFLSERCISRPDDASGKKKVERWCKIAESAAEQCGRGIIPKVHGIVSYKTALEMAKDDDLKFICYECERENSLVAKLEGVSDKDSSISFFVGAEGGFSENEVSIAEECGISRVTLGKRILRCETAPLFVLSVMSALLDE